MEGATDPPTTPIVDLNGAAFTIAFGYVSRNSVVLPLLPGTDAESVDGTTVTTSTAVIIDAGLAIWGLDTLGARVIRNNAILSPQPTGTPVKLYYSAHTVQVLNSAGTWYFWTGAAWSTLATASYTLTAPSPSQSKINQASANFTVQGSNLSGSVTVTPSDSANRGIFNPSSVVISPASPTATFTYTPLLCGSATISTTNSGGLTNPAGVAFSSPNIAPGYPGFTTTWFPYEPAGLATVTLATGLTGDPFGGATAASITEDTENDSHWLGCATAINTNDGLTLVPNATYTLSVYVKRGTGTRNVTFGMNSPSWDSAFGANFDTSTGADLTVNGGAYGQSSQLSTNVRSIGTGWWLFQVTGILGNYTVGSMTIALTNGTTYTYAGDGTSSLLINRASVQ